MQLNLAFLDSPEPLPTAPKSPPPAAWEQLDEVARIAALGLLARLIARVLADAPAEGTAHE
jgi:hypothetical protein